MNITADEDQETETDAFDGVGEHGGLSFASTEVAFDDADRRSCSCTTRSSFARFDAPGQIEILGIGSEFGAAFRFDIGSAALEAPGIFGDELARSADRQDGW